MSYHPFPEAFQEPIQSSMSVPYGAPLEYKLELNELCRFYQHRIREYCCRK